MSTMTENHERQRRQQQSSLVPVLAFFLIVLVVATGMRMFSGDSPEPASPPATNISDYMPNQADCNVDPTLMGC